MKPSVLSLRACPWCLLAAGLLSLAPAGWADSPKAPATAPASQPATAPARAEPAIQPQAEEILRAACQRLAAAKSFAVSAEVWEDVLLGPDWKVQSARTVELWVRRPDRLHALTQSAAHQRSLWYDGQALCLLDPGRKLYGTVPVSGTLDHVLDFVADGFGINLPLADLIVSDPYAAAVRNVITGRWLGPEFVEGVRCQHLAFTQENVDWQVWVDGGPESLLRKLVITYKTEPQSPQFSAVFHKWDLDVALPDRAFVAELPVGAVRIPVAPATQPGEPEATGPPRGAGQPREAHRPAPAPPNP